MDVDLDHLLQMRWQCVNELVNSFHRHLRFVDHNLFYLSNYLRCNIVMYLHFGQKRYFLRNFSILIV
jgi:hypothetical protein